MTYRPFFIRSFFRFYKFYNRFSQRNHFLYLASEPLIRIGLATNARSVSITTTDSSLVAISPEEPNKMLATNKDFCHAARLSSAGDRDLQFRNSECRIADGSRRLATDIREATGEKAFAMLAFSANTWRVHYRRHQGNDRRSQSIQSRFSRQRF